MGYLSLYRKWRPKNFSDLVGQTAVVKTLQNALLNNRIAHAYLFCGPRGTGKTSTAKVFAKALNCEKSPTLEPCNQCFSCEQINSGRSVDVIEIDAASNRRIDEIRDLREKVKFSPSEGDYKVYIIDEVHMLTKEAFNALLKTLEEPPQNVVFILATTEPHKVLSTIQSRCQRFDFGLLSIKELKTRLGYICEKEGISIDDAALNLIARTAEGGMRDAISILDQTIAFSGDKITIGDVITILGKVDQQILAEFAQIIVANHIERGLNLINEIADQGKDLNQFVKDLLFYFRDLMLIKECGVNNTIIDLPQELKIELTEQAEKFTIKELLKVMEILSETDQKLKFSSQPRLLLEMTVIKLASPEVDHSLSSIISRLSKLEEIIEGGKPVLTTTLKQKDNEMVSPERTRVISANITFDEKIGSEEQNVETDTISKEQDNLTSADGQLEILEEVNISMEEMENYWEITLDLLNKYNETRKLRAFLLQGKPSFIMGNTLYIAFPESSTFHKTNAEKGVSLLEKALKKVTGKVLKAVCIFEGEEPESSLNSELKRKSENSLQVSNVDDVEADPLVQKALKIFGGKVIRVEKE